MALTTFTTIDMTSTRLADLARRASWLIIGRCTDFDILNCICLNISRVELSMFVEFDDQCLNLFCDI